MNLTNSYFDKIKSIVWGNENTISYGSFNLELCGLTKGKNFTANFNTLTNVHWAFGEKIINDDENGSKIYNPFFYGRMARFLLKNNLLDKVLVNYEDFLKMILQNIGGTEEEIIKLDKYLINMNKVFFQALVYLESSEEEYIQYLTAHHTRSDLQNILLLFRT